MTARAARSKTTRRPRSCGHHMPLTELAERTRVTVYRTLAGSGALPRRAALAIELGVTVDDLDGVLDELSRHRHVILKNGEVELAHPFATRSFRFSVMG